MKIFGSSLSTEKAEKSAATNSFKEARQMRTLFFQVLILIIFMGNAMAISLDDVMRGVGSAAKTETTDDATVVSGLKEALAIGTENALQTNRFVEHE